MLQPARALEQNPWAHAKASLLNTTANEPDTNSGHYLQPLTPLLLLLPPQSRSWRPLQCQRNHRAADAAVSLPHAVWVTPAATVLLLLLLLQCHYRTCVGDTSSPLASAPIFTISPTGLTSPSHCGWKRAPVYLSCRVQQCQTQREGDKGPLQGYHTNDCCGTGA